MWDFSILWLESAGKRTDAPSVNLIRLCYGFLLLSLTAWLSTVPITNPLDANPPGNGEIFRLLTQDCIYNSDC